MGARRPGRRRQAAERFHAAIARPAATDPRSASAAANEGASWWTHVQQAVGILAAAATLLVVGFTWLSIQQVNNEQAITREGQIADRYNAAVENLGHDSLEVRLGGIYALQRHMQDSKRDQPVVISVLSTYIRTHAPQPKKGKRGPDQPTSDVETALTALVTRDFRHDGTAAVDLTGAYLHNANLEGANLTGAQLTRANLTRANLYGANLNRANLNRANLDGAQLTGANLYYAYLYDANLTYANLGRANLAGAYLYEANLTNANLRRANLRRANLEDVNLAGAQLTGANLDGTRQ